MVPEYPFVRKTFLRPFDGIYASPADGRWSMSCLQLNRKMQKRSERAPVVIIISSGYWLGDATNPRNRQGEQA